MTEMINDIKSKILATLSEKGVSCDRCPACRKEMLNLENECIRNIAVSDINKVCAAVLFTCGNCGFLAQFSLKAFGLEVNTEVFSERS
jgi:hypothetical protein